LRVFAPARRGCSESTRWQRPPRAAASPRARAPRAAPSPQRCRRTRIAGIAVARAWTPRASTISLADGHRAGATAGDLGEQALAQSGSARDEERSQARAGGSAIPVGAGARRDCEGAEYAIGPKAEARDRGRDAIAAYTVDEDGRRATRQ
jgi:hypothetical protein